MKKVIAYPLAVIISTIGGNSIIDTSCKNIGIPKGDSDSLRVIDTAINNGITNGIDDSLMVSKDTSYYTICSFNIKWVGHYLKKDTVALADLLKDYDIVLVQEMIAPPISGIYPDGTVFTVDPQSAGFTDEMMRWGFQYLLSEEDTGPGEDHSHSGGATEWWIAFYKPNKILVDTTLPGGFLANNRFQNEHYDRVPYAFPFKTKTGNTDFVLISVHLAQGDDNETRRISELENIIGWIDNHNEVEKDFLILGDMNFESCNELPLATPSGYKSLNDECRKTNTNIDLDDPDRVYKPFDHVMYATINTSREIDELYDLSVIDLVSEMQQYWTIDDPYPGNPYDHNLFSQYYSDHNPVIFQIMEIDKDDD